METELEYILSKLENLRIKDDERIEELDISIEENPNWEPLHFQQREVIGKRQGLVQSMNVIRLRILELTDGE